MQAAALAGGFGRHGIPAATSWPGPEQRARRRKAEHGCGSLRRLIHGKQDPELRVTARPDPDDRTPGGAQIWVSLPVFVGFSVGYPDPQGLQTFNIIINSVYDVLATSPSLCLQYPLFFHPRVPQPTPILIYILQHRSESRSDHTSDLECDDEHEDGYSPVRSTTFSTRTS